jgi:hypothetical protein
MVIAWWWPMIVPEAKKHWVVLKTGVYDDRPWNCAPRPAVVRVVHLARTKS